MQLTSVECGTLTITLDHTLEAANFFVAFVADPAAYISPTTQQAAVAALDQAIEKAKRTIDHDPSGTSFDAAIGLAVNIVAMQQERAAIQQSTGHAAADAPPITSH
jgi:hypothetical protein